MLKKVLTLIDFAVIAVSACAADSESIAPLIICAVATLILIPLAISCKEDREDEDGI